MAAYLQCSAATPSASDLTSAFSSVLGHSPSATDLNNLENMAQQGKPLTDIRASVASSAPSVQNIKDFYHNLFGPNFSPSDADLKNCENALAAGQSLKDQQAGLRQSFAHSTTEATAVSGLYKDVLGHRHARGAHGAVHDAAPLASPAQATGCAGAEATTRRRA